MSSITVGAKQTVSDNSSKGNPQHEQDSRGRGDLAQFKLAGLLWWDALGGSSVLLTLLSFY